MDNKMIYTPGELRYLKLLAKQFPTVQDASNEVIRLEAILNLPKGTEHFMSDIHGEHEAFLHILESSSGEVKVKLKEFFGKQLSEETINDLATLIYYPEGKLSLVTEGGAGSGGLVSGDHPPVGAVLSLCFCEAHPR